MKQIIITSLFIVCFAGIVSVTIFGKHGIVYMMHLQQELHNIESENKMLSTKNAYLRKQIGLLTNSTGYIEKIARNELGLARSNELIYLVQNAER